MKIDSRAPLAGALRNAAAALNAEQPPPELKARVLAAAGRAAPASAPKRTPATPRRATWWSPWSGAVACGVVLSVSALLMLRPPATPPGSDALPIAGADFVPLVPPERWPSEAAPAWLVRTEMPGERLAALGLPYDPARAGDSVRAELLLHPSGEVLAVRLVH